MIIVTYNYDEWLKEPIKVYNLEVEGLHTYYVTADRVLVHNEYDASKLTRSQQKAVDSADNIINDHLKESDIEAAIGDLQGNPIPKPGGGYWNHAQEVKDAYPGLMRAYKTLIGSLQNPNLDVDTRAFLQGKVDTIYEYIQLIEQIFSS